MQLLKITNIPIEYQIQIERARLEVNREKDLSFDVQKTPSQLQINSQDIQMRMDTYEMRRDLGMKSAAAEVSDAAQRGKQVAMDVTAQYGEDARKLEQGMDISQIIADKLFSSAQPASAVAFVPRVGPAITWQPNKIDMKYDPGDINFDWQMMRNAMDYVPGKFTMSILQYPKVSIEYMGEPNYVPPSANPNYHEAV